MESVENLQYQQKPQSILIGIQIASIAWIIFLNNFDSFCKIKHLFKNSMKFIKLWKRFLILIICILI